MVFHLGLAPRAPAHYQQLLRERSDIIRVARVICIFCMIYVHVYLFDDARYFQEPLASGLKALLVELLGRSSVPLLSVISGFLMVGYFSARPFPQALRRRAAVLLAPLVFWALVHALMGFALEPTFRPPFLALLPLADASLFLHLDFLRDIFVLGVLTPVMVLLLQRSGWLGLLLAVVLGVTDWCQPVILRGQILAFYSIGLFVGCYRIRGLSLARLELPTYAAAFLLAVALLAVALLAREADPFAQIPAQVWDLALVRPVGCLLFYFLAVRLVTRRGWLGLVKQQLEPAVFILFLSHTVTLRLLAGVLAQVPLFTQPLLYHLAWFALPFACYAAAWLLWRCLRFGPPWLQILVAGKARAGGRPSTIARVDRLLSSPAEQRNG